MRGALRRHAPTGAPRPRDRPGRGKSAAAGCGPRYLLQPGPPTHGAPPGCSRLSQRRAAEIRTHRGISAGRWLAPSLCPGSVTCLTQSSPRQPDTCLQPSLAGQLKSSASRSSEVSMIPTVPRPPPSETLCAPPDRRMEFLRPTRFRIRHWGHRARCPAGGPAQSHRSSNRLAQTLRGTLRQAVRSCRRCPLGNHAERTRRKFGSRRSPGREAPRIRHRPERFPQLG